MNVAYNCSVKASSIVTTPLHNDVQNLLSANNFGALAFAALVFVRDDLAFATLVTLGLHLLIDARPKLACDHSDAPSKSTGELHTKTITKKPLPPWPFSPLVPDPPSRCPFPPHS